MITDDRMKDVALVIVSRCGGVTVFVQVQCLIARPQMRLVCSAAEQVLGLITMVWRSSLPALGIPV